MNHSTTTREAAISQIRQMMQTHEISVHDICVNAEEPDSKIYGHLQTLLAFVGAAFILCGIATYAHIVWSDLTSLARVAIFLGSGSIAFVLGLLAIDDLRLNRAVTPLLSLGALLQTIGLFVYMAEYWNGVHAAHSQMLIFGAMTIQLALSFWSKDRIVFLFLAIIGLTGFGHAALYDVGMKGEWIATVLGLIGLLLAWKIDKSKFRVLAPFLYCCSSAAIAIASFDILNASNIHRMRPGLDVFRLLVSIGLIALSIAVKSRTVLFVGIAHFLFTIAGYTDRYFKDIIGWPVSLIVMGMVFIGSSAYALKLGRGFVPSNKNE